MNPNLPTGEVEVHELHRHSQPVPDAPFPLDDSADKVGEEIRLTHRYLDLRRPANLATLKLRHQASGDPRPRRSSLSGGRNPHALQEHAGGGKGILAPSRLNPGQFYALPQSPQQYKQMLMAAGVERYYQLGCFRDEDLRRQTARVHPNRPRSLIHRP